MGAKLRVQFRLTSELNTPEHVPAIGCPAHASEGLPSLDAGSGPTALSCFVVVMSSREFLPTV